MVNMELVSWWVYVSLVTRRQYFSDIVEVSFIGGGNWSSRGKPPTCCKLL